MVVPRPHPSRALRPTPCPYPWCPWPWPWPCSAQNGFVVFSEFATGFINWIGYDMDEEEA